MSNEIAWPTKPFYIQSRISGLNYALTKEGASGIKTRPLDYSPDFLWLATPDARGGAFLMHVGSGLYLTRVGPPELLSVSLPPFSGQNRALALQPANNANPGQLWRVEDLGSPWVGINSWTDWEQKINVYHSDLNGTTGLFHWDGGADNEKWLLLQEDGALEVLSVTYHMEHANKDFGQPPTRMTATVVDNLEGSQPVQTSVALQRTLVTTRAVSIGTSHTDSTKYTETFGIKGGVKDVFEVNASLSFEQSSSTTKSFSDTTTDSSSYTDTTTLSVSVPAGKRYRYQVAVYYAQFSIPFTAVLSFRSSAPNVPARTVTMDGEYKGVNGMRSEIEVAELPPIGSGQNQAPSVIDTIPVAPHRTLGFNA